MVVVKLALEIFRAGLLAIVLLAPGFAHVKDDALEDKLVDAFEAKELVGLHSVLVMQRGKLLAELYFPGEDQRWGDPLGLRDHGPETLHDLRSVTKSIVGLLYGIALSEGLVADIDESLVVQFPEYPDLATDPARAAITIRHALSMKMGTEWNEDLPYSDPRNSEIAMERATDRYRFVLDRPMVNEAGDWWIYNGGATALIGHLIADGTGRALDDYADEKLFAPLGITEFEWVRGADGVPSAASGLRLRTRDLAKIGSMIANDGTYDGQQIVPADWLSASFAPSANLQDGLRYGFFWWLAPDASPTQWVAGFGNGGQRLMVGPKDGTVIVVFAGNYNQADAWQLPVRITTDFVGPALRARDGN